MEVEQIARLLNDTLSINGDVVHTATEALNRLSSAPRFPFYLLSIAAGVGDRGLKVAAATYLKNFTRRLVHGENLSVDVSKEFKDQLMIALLKVEPEILKVLIEVFKVIIDAGFVKQNLWPELVPELRLAIQNSDQISNKINSELKTVNALTILQALIRPFQYFLNPKVAVESVPPQLEQIAEEILIPLLVFFHNLVEKVKGAHDVEAVEVEKILHIICKSMYFAVRSHMPSCLAPRMASFCRDLIGILDSVTFDSSTTLEDEHIWRLKTAKRSLRIFCTLATRHRKHCDKLIPEIINCVLRIVKFSANISKLDFQTHRIISLAFDVISHVLETGPGWKLVSPHFTSLLESAILPALVMNEKDISEWEEDADEYIRKNLPSDLGEVSGWRDDLFSARKSAANLLGVISMSKGPPMGNLSNGSSAPLKRKKGEKNKRNNQRCSMGELLVLPFLSKFPVPTNANASQANTLNTDVCRSLFGLETLVLNRFNYQIASYFGVLMAYGALQDFLKEQKPGYTSILVRSRVLPLYAISERVPYLVATANWVLGELASCLPEEMNHDIYSALLKALVMNNTSDVSCHPVRVSAAGAIAKLLDEDYQPPEWYPVVQTIAHRIRWEEASYDDEELSNLFMLLRSLVEAGNENVAVHVPNIISTLSGATWKCLCDDMAPLPQVVEQGFATLAVMARSWESFVAEESGEDELKQKQESDRALIGRCFSSLLADAWIREIVDEMGQESQITAPPSCIDDASTLLRSVMLCVTGREMIRDMKVIELLSAWAGLIADWHAWEESEDLSVFDCIQEAVKIQAKFDLTELMAVKQGVPSSLSSQAVAEGSIFERIGVFVSQAIEQYPSATWRAASCVHMLLHIPSYPPESSSVKQSLAVSFSRAAFSHFREIRDKPSSLWKPVLLVVSSCYLYYPDIVGEVLNKVEDGGLAAWASALSSITSSSSEVKLSGASEIKLSVLALSKVIERLLGEGKMGSSLVQECFVSVLEGTVRLKEVQEEEEPEEEEEEEDVEEENDEDEEDDDSDDEDSDIEEQEETHEEFLERYAQAAADLEDGLVVEEGDLEDQDEEPELGGLEEVDPERVILSLIEKQRDVVVKVVPSNTLLSFANAFPQYSWLVIC